MQAEWLNEKHYNPMKLKNMKLKNATIRYKNYLVIFLLPFIVWHANAQDCSSFYDYSITSGNSTISINENNSPGFTNEGTFQIILQDERMVKPKITSELLSQIESRRLEDVNVFWECCDFISIKILANETIQSESFKPVKTYSYE